MDLLMRIKTIQQKMSNIQVTKSQKIKTQKMLNAKLDRIDEDRKKYNSLKWDCDFKRSSIYTVPLIWLIPVALVEFARFIQRDRGTLSQTDHNIMTGITVTCLIIMSVHACIHAIIYLLAIRKLPKKINYFDTKELSKNQ